MRSISIFSFLFASVVAFSVTAQKVKYKDVFPLLQAGKWEEAEPLLKIYLSDPKNHDDASAQYNMGKAFERKVFAAGIIGDTASLYSDIDSAVIHFRIALTLIDEKELKKNDQYYQEFNRRDLRTGEFGIKVSDVHLDLENKIKAFEERKKNVGEFHKNVVEAEALFTELNSKMLSLQEEYGSQAELLLAMGETEQAAVTEVENMGTTINRLIELAQEANFDILNSKFTFSAEKKRLDDLANYSSTRLNLKSGGIMQVWDLAEWAAGVKSSFRLEILPFRQELIGYDRELEAIKQQLEQTGDAGAFPIEVNTAIVDKIRKFEENSVTEKLLRFKVGELNYIAEALPAAYPDSSNVDEMYLKHQQLLDRLSNMLQHISISEPEMDKAFRSNPAFFESRYVSLEKLKEYISEKKEFIALKHSELSNQMDYWMSRKNWLITDTGDSISLFVRDSIFKSAGYRTLHLLDSGRYQVTGLKNVEKDLYFFASQISPAYTSSWMIEEKLPAPDKDFVFSANHMNHAPAPEGYSTFYTYYPVKGKTHLFMTTIDGEGKPLWKISTEIARPPVKISFNKMVMETIVYLEQPQGDPTNDLAYIVVDRTGKVRK